METGGDGRAGGSAALAFKRPLALLPDEKRYDVELVRQGEVWVLQRVTIDNVWRMGDPAVFSGI